MRPRVRCAVTACVPCRAAVSRLAGAAAVNQQASDRHGSAMVNRAI
ncbi:MAG: hypothetical protein QFF03_15355 [Pseudomonadota bacterium]|nr:hypothetical protein [Pseudomonadota bacterium]